MKIFGMIAAVLGLAGVALGAFGAHALRPRLEAAGLLDVWQTAVLYHLHHAVSLLAIAGRAGAWPVRASWCWIAGVIGFSGSLYLLALGAPGWLGPVTPLGGLALLAGWAIAAHGFWRETSTR